MIDCLIPPTRLPIPINIDGSAYYVLYCISYFFNNPILFLLGKVAGNHNCWGDTIVLLFFVGQIYMRSMSRKWHVVLVVWPWLDFSTFPPAHMTSYTCLPQIRRSKWYYIIAPPKYRTPIYPMNHIPLQPPPNSDLPNFPNCNPHSNHNRIPPGLPITRSGRSWVMPDVIDQSHNSMT